jgi:polyhydroxybutyrate depolymerase
MQAGAMNANAANGRGRAAAGMIRLLAACALAMASSVAARVALADACPFLLGPGLHTVVVRSGGAERPMALLVPAGAKPGKPLALVFDLHGSGSNGEGEAVSTRLRDLADREDFLVAHPDGGVTAAGHPDQHYWNIPGVPLVTGAAVPPGTGDDVQFIGDAIDAVARATCVDPRRVYVTGMSGGARMASLLACRLADRIAAVAPVAGLRAGLPGSGPDQAPSPADCQPVRPMPVVTFHGSDDPVNPYAGGGSPYWGYAVPVALRRWVQIDGCDPSPKVKQVAKHVVLERYKGCKGDADVLLYRTEARASEGGGHVWPGGQAPRDLPAGTDPAVAAGFNPGHEIDASRLIWDFFKDHRLPR